MSTVKNIEETKNINQEIIDLLRKNNIPDNEIVNTLNATIRYFNDIKYTFVHVNPDLLFKLQDLVWFNFEQFVDNTYEPGIYKMSALGSPFFYIIAY